MKRIIIPLFVCLIVSCFLSADLIERYKKGEIKLIPDSKFGMNTNWDLLFRKNIDNHFAFLPDGSFFRSASKAHKIYKFSDNGDILFEFGQEGQGPGDINNPLELSILDEQYLLVRELASQRRVSIFDLNGEFYKLIKLPYAVFGCTALKENKIAILAKNYITENNFSIENFTVFIRDISSGDEIKIASFQRKSKKTVFSYANFFEEVYVLRLKDGNFVIAFSGSPEISIYSAKGKKLYSFQTNLEREKITKKDVQYFTEKAINNAPTQFERKRLKNFVEMRKNQIFFPDYFPYYQKITIDSEDNLLVFLNKKAFDSEDKVFQVYSKDGKYICTTKVNSGNFIPKYLEIFHQEYVYMQLENKDHKGTSFLAKIKIF